MINFRTHLQAKITDVLTNAVGATSGVEFPVVTFDDHLHDVEMTAMPFVVVNVRTAEKAAEAEIGSKYDLFMWTVHIYYLDIEEEWDVGENKRNTILSEVQKALEENRRLDNLEVVNPDDTREYVYDSTISAVLFDSSGQEEYYSFVSELYLNVYTAKN